MWRFIASLALLLTVLNGRAQHESALKTRMLHFPLPDSLLLDSFTVNPESIQLLLPNQTKLDTSYYTYDINSGWLRFKKSLLADSGTVSIQYEAMSVQLTKVYRHKDTTLLFPELKQFYDPFAASNAAGSSDWLETGGLVKSGSITRGFSVGNRQDFALNSSLNLILSGKLNNDLEIQAAISDASIPVQPDGNTQQIQEFDKIFIRLSKDKTSFTAGDIETHSTDQDYFLRYNRKAQGASLSSELDPGLIKNDHLGFTVSGAFGKGRYARQEINAIESNRGPYKLRGNNNENYIIVLAGSEKVFVDGAQLTRGEENDYIIDYNTAEITFTNRVVISSKTRIIAEFEYSDKNYARSLVSAGADYKVGKFSAGISLLSETDLKNQTIMQELSDEQKAILAQAGDQPDLAIASGIDSIGFNTSRVLYALRDSLGYDSVFVYSTHPDSAHFALSFSYVGSNHGNYIQTGSDANGRVFKWVAPTSGIPQGDYEPVILLITPKKTSLYTFRTAWQFSTNTMIKAEYAQSDKDLNLFSDLDDDNNKGRALMFSFNHRKEIGKDTTKKWLLDAVVRGDVTDHAFSIADRFRSVEFDRDWNSAFMDVGGNRWFGEALVSLKNRRKDYFGLSSGIFLRDAVNRAIKHSFQADKRWKKLRIESKISWLESPAAGLNTQFLRHHHLAELTFGKMFSGIETDGESRKTRIGESTLLHSSSAAWWSGKIYYGLSDSSGNKIRVYYTQRTDTRPDSTYFVPEINSQDWGAEAGGSPWKGHEALARISYRRLNYSDSIVSKEEFVLGRTEYSGRLKNRLLVFSMNYEAGSGMEAKKEFTYLEVAPGQGNYAWIDYNGNNIRELNEFESAAFSDQGNFIRVFTPTNDYIRVFYSNLAGSLSLALSEWIKKEKGPLSWLARISNRSAFSWDKKTSSNQLIEMYIPFSADENDTTLVTQISIWRNIASFKSKNGQTSIIWTNTSGRNRGLLTNGVEDRSNESNELKLIQTIRRVWNIEMSLSNGNKNYSSEYFQSNNYAIREHAIRPIAAWQPGTTFRWSWIYQYSEKNNTLSTQRAIVRKAGTELKFSKSGTGLALLQFNMLQINFLGTTDSNLGYIMLEGLKPGRNFTWNLSIQRTLGSNMQLNFMYEGRSSEGNPVIHTGNVQVRVFF